MRSIFSILLIVTFLFAGGYFYNFALAVCPIPITYRVGELDERFGLTEDEARVVIAEAAELWEEATGQNLFSYDENADFTVNFIYDERQGLIDEESNFNEKLNTTKEINNALTDTYDALVSEYETLKADFEIKVALFDERFDNYNQTVRQYNAAGGAPPKVYEELDAERNALEAERAVINEVSGELDDLVAEINKLGQKGNALVEHYNENVAEFNSRFGGLREFTQGDYTGGRINIYTYQNEWELTAVLAHELGHALSLGHVEGAESLMHYLIGGQPLELAPSQADVAEFNRVCGEMNLWDKIVYRLDLS